jgi:hypothetical protein
MELKVTLDRNRALDLVTEGVLSLKDIQEEKKAEQKRINFEWGP